MDYPLTRFNEVSDRTPHLVKVSPAWMASASGTCRMWTRQAASPPSCASWRSSRACSTSTRPPVWRPLGEVIATAENRNPACLPPIDQPHSDRGALARPFGNLAPEGAVVKIGAVDQHELRFRGPARVFDSEEDATQPS